MEEICGATNLPCCKCMPCCNSKIIKQREKNKMKLWVDDIRTPPSAEWVWIKSVNDTIIEIIYDELNVEYKGEIYLISLDHDAGDYANDGGDYIKILDWLEETGRNYPIHIHSMNVVGAENMRRIIEKNGWKEVH